MAGRRLGAALCPLSGFTSSSSSSSSEMTIVSGTEVRRFLPGGFRSSTGTSCTSSSSSETSFFTVRVDVLVERTELRAGRLGPADDPAEPLEIATGGPPLGAAEEGFLDDALFALGLISTTSSSSSSGSKDGRDFLVGGAISSTASSSDSGTSGNEGRRRVLARALDVDATLGAAEVDRRVLDGGLIFSCSGSGASPRLRLGAGALGSATGSADALVERLDRRGGILLSGRGKKRWWSS